MSNEFDQRYIDAEGTPEDITIGTGELAVSLSAVRKAIGGGGGTPEPVVYAKQSDLDLTNTEVASLKLDTDNKIQSVATAIISKGGTVAGTPPTAGQLVTGVNSIPSGESMSIPHNSNFVNRYGTGVDELGNIYMIESLSGWWVAKKYSKNMTLLQTASLIGTSQVYACSKFGYGAGNANTMNIHNWEGTLLKSFAFISEIGGKIGTTFNEVAIIYYLGGTSKYRILDMNGTTVSSIDVTTSDINFSLNKKNSFIIRAGIDTIHKLSEPYKVPTVLFNTNTILHILDLQNW